MTNKIFIISGPSGCGKNTIIEELVKIPDLNLFKSKSYTTRAERESDITENKYIFVNEDEFKKKEISGEILESNFYNNCYYGTSKSEIEKALVQGKNVIKDIDVNGGARYREILPDAVLIFIYSQIENIKDRLVKRDQNTPEEIDERLKIAENEIKAGKNYDYFIENPEGHPEIAVENIKNIILKELQNGN